MSENPYARMVEWHEAYRKAAMTRVPVLAMVQDAFAHDEIDVLDLERLTEAALTGTAVEIPPTMFALRYRPL